MTTTISIIDPITGVAPFRREVKLTESEERVQFPWRFCPICGRKLENRTRPGSICITTCKSWSEKLIAEREISLILAEKR